MTRGGSTKCDVCGQDCRAGARWDKGVVYTCQSCGYMFLRKNGINTPYIKRPSGWQQIRDSRKKPIKPSRSDLARWIDEQGFNARIGEQFVRFADWKETNEQLDLKLYSDAT